MRTAFLFLAAGLCWSQDSIINLKDLTDRINQSPTAALYLTRATELLRFGDARLAVGDYSEGIRLSKDDPAPNPELWTGRGIAYIALQQFTSAIDDFSHAIGLKPEAVLPYSERGFAYSQTGDFQHALTDFDTVLEREPNNDRTLEQRGAVWTKLGEPAKAIEDYTRALEISPDDFGLHLARATQYAAMGNQKDALADRDQAVRLKPDFAETHSARADSYLQLGLHDEEMADRNAAIHLSPDWPEGWLARGRTNFLHGEYSNALGDLNRALELKPDDAETRLVMVKTLEAIERAEAAAKAEPAPVESQPVETATAEPKQPDPVPSQSTVSAATHNKLGRDLLNAHKYPQAIQELSEAIHLQPMFPQALNARGFTYYLMKDYPHALADLDLAIAQDPNYVNASVTARKLGCPRAMLTEPRKTPPKGASYPASNA